MNTYGLHCIHGRAPAVATGVALARPDLDVWVIGGDGDMLSIGGNHLIHALRRNVNLKILMFNNQIYGLTKGQYSPTSELGQGHEVVAVRLARPPVQPDLGRARRRGDVRRPHPRHGPQAHDGGVPAGPRARGRAFVEIYQNCNVFNDGAFEAILAKEARADMLIDLKHGEPIRFGADSELGVVLNEFGECEIVDVADVGEDALLVHDEHRADPTLAFALSRLADHADDADAGRRVPRGRPADVRGRGAAPARRRASERRAPATSRALIGSGATWEVD